MIVFDDFICLECSEDWDKTFISWNSPKRWAYRGAFYDGEKPSSFPCVLEMKDYPAEGVTDWVRAKKKKMKAGIQKEIARLQNIEKGLERNK